MTPASEITATSVVPPPMSRSDFHRLLNRQARPIAAATGLLDQRDLAGSGVPRRVADRRRSTCVIPAGTPITTRVLTTVRTTAASGR